MDWRKPENRREAFTRSYLHSLRYRNFPGCVYFALPHMAQALEWDTEERYWAAWLNANTQNPVTTLLLMEAGSTPRYHERVAKFQEATFGALAWDTDRRHFKSSKVFGPALARYAEITSGGQSKYWAGVKDWDEAWSRMTALPFMGRLSAWSGLEYMRLLGDQPLPDADTLLLSDVAGSRSHRNGLALVGGYDELVKDNQLNPGGEGKWTPDFTSYMAELGEDLLEQARSYDASATRLTLESALCTWKSWHKRNRRYPNVYSDMMYERLRWAEARHGQRFGVLWDARSDALPAHLRLEDSPGDPGLKAVKQNHYRNTGEVILLGHEEQWKDMWSSFDQRVADGKYGTCR
jgi:hypothetical protein